MQGRHRSVLSTLLVTLTCSPLWAQVPSTAFVNFEGAQTNPIRISADGSRLFAVNTPAGTVSVFNLAQPSPGERPHYADRGGQRLRRPASVCALSAIWHANSAAIS